MSDPKPINAPSVNESPEESNEDTESPEAADESDDESPGASDDSDDSISQPSRSRMLSAYGVVSVALGMLLTAAIVTCASLWSSHHSEVHEQQYQIRAKKAAAEWALVLMNMNNDDLDASLRRLRDGTAGELKADFDAAMQPFREAVQRLPSYRATQIESVVIQSVHHDLGDISMPPSGAAPPSKVGSRTDTIQVAATSVSGDATGKPQTMYWNLLVDISQVDDNLLISGLRVLR